MLGNKENATIVGEDGKTYIRTSVIELHNMGKASQEDIDKWHRAVTESNGEIEFGRILNDDHTISFVLIWNPKDFPVDTTPSVINSKTKEK